jgi:hypothetical protein
MPALSSLASNPMVQSVMQQVGTSLAQAVGGSGALLNLAQNKLPAADASKLSSSVPGMNEILGQSKAIGGFSSINSMQDANGVMSKLGMNPSQISQMPQALSGYIQSAAGPNIASLLSNIWR